MAHKCDATFTDTQEHCSDDIIEVWHGMATPAYSCGKHSTGSQLIFQGHRAREATNAA